MSPNDIDRDERTLAVENASYRLSYRVLSFGVLVLVAYRAFVRNDPHNWDLMLLVIASGAVSTVYQASRSTLSRRWVMMTVVITVVAGLIAAGIVAARYAG